MTSHVLLRRGSKIFLSLLILVLTCELGLRVQQWVGPFHDLEFDFLDEQARIQSDTLNHIPPLSVEAVLDDPVIYGEHTGLRYRLRYNSDGIRINQQRPVPSPDREDLTTILFLGDSFTQEYDDKNTLPQRTWEHLKAEIPPGFNLQILNAGLGSYSPAILIPQAKKLLPIYRPDLVVVVIDETDLPDDYFRYEQLIRRNSAGEVIAVRATPLDTEFLEGFRNIALHPLYLARVGHKLYHTAVFMPSFLAGYRSWLLPQILHFLGDRRGEIDEFFATETLVFRRNLMELGRVLVELVGDKTRVIFVRHPHLGHLRELNDPQRWKDLVAPYGRGSRSATRDSVLQCRDRHEENFRCHTRALLLEWGYALQFSRLR